MPSSGKTQLTSMQVFRFSENLKSIVCELAERNAVELRTSGVANRRAERLRTEVQYQSVTLIAVFLGGAPPGRHRNVPQQIRY